MKNLVFVFALVATLATSNPTRGQAFLPQPVVEKDFYGDGSPDSDKFELGRMLFFDKILSGNRNIACATCHHPSLASTDALALPLGEGPKGLGIEREVGADLSESVAGRVPRNSPALFNLGAKEFSRMFHDGRVEADMHGFYEGGFVTPAKWKLPAGLDNVLAAQAMFPVTSDAEMAGNRGENPVAEAVALNNAAGPNGVWSLLSQRLQAIPEYVVLFKKAFPSQVEGPNDINFVLAANAIAEFESHAFRADDSPFDRYLRGDKRALSRKQVKGMKLFYGKAGCGSCHSGKFQTDHEFHAIAMPQIGPGKGDGTDASYWSQTGVKALLEDHGRGRVTKREQDNYKFRTPSLRNVTLTGPWGHAGAYDSLEAVVKHHLAPEQSLMAFNVNQVSLPPVERVVELTGSGSRFSQTWVQGARLEGYLQKDDWVMSQQALKQNIANASSLAPVSLSNREVSQVISFLESLTDFDKNQMLAIVPEGVPSGLPVVD